MYLLPQLTKRIVLVSGDGDYMFSDIEKYKPIIESPYIIKWFSQNLLFTHDKLVHMPIGLGYHAYFNGDKWDLNPNIIEQETAIIDITKKWNHFIIEK